jgi:hypothetical protein
MRLAALAVVVLAAGCGLAEAPPPAAMGPGCAADSECVPNGCCGTGTDAVHVSLGPSCSGTVCMIACPAQGVKCGCGVPVCRDSRCAVALSAEPQCL